MTTKCYVVGLAGLVLLAGCLPSLNPVFTERDLVFDEAVLGKFVHADSQNEWEFTKRDGMSYRLVYTDKDGQQGRFIARLADVDGTRFLDLFPEEIQLEASNFWKAHLVPIHTIYLVKQTQPDLELAVIDFKWLEKYLADHPDSIQFAAFNGRKMITAPTEELQAFLLKHKAMFTGNVKLKRQTNTVN